MWVWGWHVLESTLGEVDRDEGQLKAGRAPKPPSGPGTAPGGAPGPAPGPQRLIWRLVWTL